MKLSHAIELYNEWREGHKAKSTNYAYNLNLKQFALFMHDCDIEKVTIGDVQEWLNLMRSLGWGNNTFLNKTMALRTFFEYFMHQKLRVVDPWLIPVPKKEFNMPRIASRDVVKQILSVVKNPRDQAMIRLLADTGIRSGELINLRLSDINLRTRTAVIRTEKSRGTKPFREILWTPETNYYFLEWAKECETELLFNVSTACVLMTIRRYCQKAGIPTINPHALRHMKGREIIEKGGSGPDVMNALGHAKLESSSIYVALFGKPLIKRLQKFLP